MKTIAEEIGDGADRRRKRIRVIERYVSRAGENGISTSEIKAVAEYQLGLTAKKVGEIIKLLRKVKKIRKNDKDRWVSI